MTTTTAPCPHHANPQASPGLVRLWDGRDYCVGCVEDLCPGLAEFARGRPALEDAIAYNQAGGLIAWSKVGGLFFVVLALVAVGIFAAMDLTSALSLVGAMGAVLAFAMLASLPAVFKAKLVLPTVRVVDGVVEVFRDSHAHGQRPVATYPLLEARWHLGRLRDDTYCRGRGGAMVLDRPAIVLRTPRKWKGVSPLSEITAIGSSPEMVRLWRGFLRLAEVPEGG